MNFVSTIGLSALTQWGVMGTFSVSSPAASSTSQIAKDFFADLALRPSHHFMPILFFAVLGVAALMGILFLIKKLYDAKCPISPPKTPIA